MPDLRWRGNVNGISSRDGDRPRAMPNKNRAEAVFETASALFNLSNHVLSRQLTSLFNQFTLDHSLDRPADDIRDLLGRHRCQLSERSYTSRVQSLLKNRTDSSNRS